MRSLLLILLVACADRSVPTPNREAAPKPSKVDARFVPQLRAAAASYQKWGRVDERPNVAPMMCDMPRPEHYGSKGHVRMSEADESPHGKKLYYLWASDRAGYAKLSVKPGFAIVKESFAATPASQPRNAPAMVTDSPLHSTVGHDGKWFTTGAAKGLYVMAKVGEGDGTDAGWIYGTITTDGVVTSAGRVATCMGCHEEAAHDRLFGLRPVDD